MNTVMERWALVFAVLATLGLILNMVAIPLNTQDIFLKRESLSPLEVMIVLGFVAVLVFNLLVLAWVGKEFHSGRKSWLNWLILALSLGGIVLLMADKVLLDELAREHILGAGAGEWLMLYICFAGQLVLNLLILLRFLPISGIKDSSPRSAPVSD